MELPHFMKGLKGHGAREIKTIEMHTTGEPTRIVYAGFPDLTGTLLEQRAQAQREHDYIRRALICEPRGHRDMYGAVLISRTELPEATLGVLFLTNEGYSTMCGHATLALGRLFVDYFGKAAFDGGVLDTMKRIDFDEAKGTALVRLHAPCGLVHVTVPIVQNRDGSWTSNKNEPVSYLSVPSYATAISIHLDVPPEFQWPELTILQNKNDEVVFDVAYGGAFYIIVPATSLGFKSLRSADLKALSEAARRLSAAFNSPEAVHLRKEYLVHPQHRDLEFLYGVIVTETEPGGRAENGLCFFADEQIDRSPTGSGVQARVALAYAKGERGMNEPFVYHSPVSKAFGDEGAFVGEAVEAVDVGGDFKAVTVKVSGSARYTGCCNFLIEDGDKIGEGFWFDEVMNQRP